MKKPFSVVRINASMMEDDLVFVPFTQKIPVMSERERRAWTEPEPPKYEPTEFEIREGLIYEDSYIPSYAR